MTHEELKNYFRNKLGWGWGYQAREVFGFLCEASEACKGGVILDAGAGHQRYKPFFQDCLYIAQEHPEAGKQNKGIKEYDILCDVRSIPLRNECIDIILSTVSFEHMEYPQEFVNEAFRVLKPGGSLWLQAPCVYNEHEVPYDFQRVTRYGLMRHFRHAGFNSYWVKPNSSSTATGIFALKFGIQEDSRRLNAAIYVKIITKVLLKLTDCYLRILKKVFDRGPFEDTTMPICWISCATKTGKLAPTNRGNMDAKEFVKTNALGQ